MFFVGDILKLLPLQGALLNAMIPRALPWARRGCPFGAQGDGGTPTWGLSHTPWFTFAPYALKGQKLLAQGSALGNIWTQTCRPVRAKAFKYRAITKPPSTSIRTSIACGKPAGFRDPGWTSEPPISLARFALCAGQRDAGGRGVGEDTTSILVLL